MHSQKRTVTVPITVLSKLLTAQADSSAHYNLCTSTPETMSSHPGDPFGETIAWLWLSGQRDLCAMTVTNYLAEMRIHNPNSPEEGSRLTWEALRTGLTMASGHCLEPHQMSEMLDYLDHSVPGLFGQPLERLNMP